MSAVQSSEYEYAMLQPRPQAVRDAAERYAAERRRNASEWDGASYLARWWCRRFEQGLGGTSAPDLAERRGRLLAAMGAGRGRRLD